MSGALALAMIAGLTLACLRKRPNPPSPQSPPKSQPAPDAQRALDPTFLVLVWMESTPPGARIVRVADGHVFGYTPEIVEFHQASEPEVVRFEMAGYLPLIREVPAVSDGSLAVVLEAIPKKRTPATKKSKGSKIHKSSN
jgi:hypothetical protein